MASTRSFLLGIRNETDADGTDDCGLRSIFGRGRYCRSDGVCCAWSVWDFVHYRPDGAVDGGSAVDDGGFGWRCGGYARLSGGGSASGGGQGWPARYGGKPGRGGGASLSRFRSGKG